MYAIIRSGGKQYKVQPGDIIRVEKLEHALGSEVDLTDILMVNDGAAVVGKPMVENAKVTVVITKQTRDRKVVIFKKKRRQGYRRYGTHRQHFTELFVKAISVNGKTEKSETEAKVLDVDKARQDRIQARSQGSPELEAASDAPVKKTVKKKLAKKAPAKKKSAAPKKKAAGKKKVAKKTSKKA